MELNVTQMGISNFYKVRFNNTIVNLRKALNLFIFDPKDPQKGLEIFESHSFKYYFITSESLSHYVGGTKPPTKRILLCWLINLISWINFIKYLLLYMINDQWIWMFFGDPLYLFKRRDLLALFYSVLFLWMALAGRIF